MTTDEPVTKEGGSLVPTRLGRLRPDERVLIDQLLNRRVVIR